jgi:hypothetical protein
MLMQIEESAFGNNKGRILLTMLKEGPSFLVDSVPTSTHSLGAKIGYDLQQK